MTTRDEHGNLHDRSGRFSPRHNSAPSSALNADSGGARPFGMVILDEPDPVGGFDTAVSAPTGEYYLRDGVQHRLDGPSYEGVDGSQEWRRNGELSREDGPAVVDGEYEEHWVEGVPLSA